MSGRSRASRSAESQLPTRGALIWLPARSRASSGFAVVIHSPPVSRYVVPFNLACTAAVNASPRAA